MAKAEKIKQNPQEYTAEVIRQMEKTKRTGPRVSGHSEKYRPGRHPFRLVIVLFTIYLVLPLAVTLIYSLVQDWSTSWIPRGFTLHNYAGIFADGDFWASLFRTLLISLLPILLTTGILLLIMFVVTLYVPKLEKVVQTLCMLPYALQGVILSIGVISIYTGTGTILSNRMLMLLGAYCIMILPYIYQGIRNNLYGISASMLIEAAQMLGAGKMYSYWHIIVPNIIPGITVSMLLSLSIIFGDFVLANNIAGNSYKNIQVYLQQLMTTSSGQSSAVVVILFSFIFLITGLVLVLQSGGKKAENEGV